MAGKYSKFKGLTVGHGNLKLDKSIGIFNLPAGKEYTCSQTCPKCFAIKAQKLYPTVLPCRLRNWERSKDDNFVSDMVELIRKAKFKTFRIHESGDFYDQEYVDKWQRIINALPRVRFYCYTKENIELTGKNINIVRSILPGGEFNYGGNIFLAKMQSKYRFPVCPATLNGRGNKVRCGKHCKLCLSEKYMLFKIH